MEIRALHKNDLTAVVGLYNAVAAELGYVPFGGPAAFAAHFLGAPDYCAGGLAVAVQNGQVAGLVAVLYKKVLLPEETHQNTPGFLNLLLVEKRLRGQGVGTALLHWGEAFLRKNGKNQAVLSHKCPIKVSWYVDEQLHQHNKAPGIIKSSEGAAFLRRRGYQVACEEVSYYKQLSKYQTPAYAQSQIAALAQQGIHFGWFDASVHTDYGSLFTSLKDESFRQKFANGMAEGRDILVGAEGSRVCATAGTVYPEANGRGFFSAIGVDPAYSGRHIGTALFHTLCQKLREKGAVYMTFFTGADNLSARCIYEKAGFSIVREWAILNKKL